MIIKSMSRKEATFSQLVDYFEDCRQDSKFTVYDNVYANNPESIKAEFNKNATFLKKRKNGVYMYHEVLSITKSAILPEDQQKEILKDIALNYIKSRAKNNLVYGVLHHDKKDNLHYHFMISSNEIESDKKHRFSKEEFSQFKKNLELYVLEVYPELEQKKLINKEQKNIKEIGEKLSNKGVELKRRIGKTAQKDSLKERLRIVFDETKDKADFFNIMERENISLYVHGNTLGVIDRETNRKHRLSTLGLQYEFSVISDRLEEAEKDIMVNVDYSKNEFSKEKVSNLYLYEEQQKKANDESSSKNDKNAQAQAEPLKPEPKNNSDEIETRKVKPEEKSKDEQPKYREQNKEPLQQAKKENKQEPRQKRSSEGEIKRERPEQKHEKQHDREQHKSPHKNESGRYRNEPESEKDREIRRRKEALKKSRESEKDNAKDYSKDR